METSNYDKQKVLLLVGFLVAVIIIQGIVIFNIYNDNKKLKNATIIADNNDELVNSKLELNKKITKEINIENIRNYKATAEIIFREEWFYNNELLDNIKITRITVNGKEWEKNGDYRYTKELEPGEKDKIRITIELIEENKEYLNAIYKLSYKITYRDKSYNNDQNINYAKLTTGREINLLIRKISSKEFKEYENNTSVKKMVIINEYTNTDNMSEENNISEIGLPVYMSYNDGTVFWYTEAETIYFNNDSEYMFSNLKELKELEGFDIIDTSKVKNMSRMFYNSGIQDFRFLKYFNTSNVNEMKWMFAGIKTNNLDLSNFDTSKVEDMSGMFNGIEIDTLDLSSFDTSNVEDMSFMFDNIELNKLDLSSFDTSNVKDMHNMFFFSQIDDLNIQNFNTKNVTNMNGMFEGLKSKSLNISNFDTSNVTSMENMFSHSKIKKLDLKNFRTNKVTTMSYMFNGTDKLEYLDISSFDFSNLQKDNSYNSGFYNFINWTNPKIEIYVKNTSDKEMILKSSNELTTDNIKIK